MLGKYVFCFSFVLFFNVLCGCSSSLNAQEETFESWKKDFKSQALKAGVSRAYLNEKLPQMQLLPTVIVSDKKQSEFVNTFWTYTDGTLSKTRIAKGQKMYVKHRELVKKTAAKYGVPAKYLIAFWGIETNYGAYQGDINTLNALGTLAFDERRRTFFTKELIAFLKASEQNNWGTVTGSWAGAFGNFQFMPTTFEAYAVDGDTDDKKDLIHSLPDAFESAANYLSTMGWKADEPWGVEVKLPKNLNWDKVYAKPTRTVANWRKMGVEPYGQVSPDLSAKLVLPMGVEGPAFLTFKNYDIMMRWNRSSLYALSVGLLADRIENPKTKLHAKRVDNKVTRSDIEEIQTHLKAKGYYAGKVDGTVGPQTRQAIRKAQKKFGLPQDSYPTKELLNKLIRL